MLHRTPLWCQGFALTSHARCSPLMLPRTPLKIRGFALITHARTLMILLIPLNTARAPLSADVSAHSAKDSGLCAEPRRANADDPAPTAEHATRWSIANLHAVIN